MRTTRLRAVSSKKRAGQKAWQATRTLVVIRDYDTCILCSRRGGEVHHRKQKSLGGSDSPANLVTVCHDCHMDVHDNITLYESVGLLLNSWEPEAESVIWHNRANRWAGCGIDWEWMPRLDDAGPSVDELREHLLRRHVHAVIGGLS